LIRTTGVLPTVSNIFWNFATSPSLLVAAAAAQY
jgi:hypothetical protein